MHMYKYPEQLSNSQPAQSIAQILRQKYRRNM